MANTAEELLNDEESASEKAKKLAKEKAKQIVRKKIIAGVASFLLPILPYILIGALILAAILLVILFIASIFSFLNDTNNIYGTMEINYCSKVNLSWVETAEWEAGEVEISSDEYIDFLIEQSPYNVIGDSETMKAVAMIYRTNFYANANNLDSDVCHYEIAAPYEGVFNETVKTAIQETDNKVFALQKDVLSELYLDDKFSYTSTEELAGYPVYRLYQDNLAYKTEWVDENISEDNRENRNAEQMYSFSPFAAYYLVDVKHFNYEALLYHFYSPGNTYTQIYNVKKKGGGWGPDGGGQNGGCSDIPLSSTPLSREEFIAAVESKVSNPDFKNNAGRIYDICVENNFNPELVIIRAYLEGHFSEQGGRYNYFGIKCYNGVSKCKDFSSMDEAVLSYIQIIQGYNFSTILEVMKLYADIGEFWFNPGGSGIGGCYYYPYIKQYLSEQRAAEVANYCAEGKKCAKGGVGDCAKTTEEDDYAYSLWQVQRMVEERQKFFGIGAQECPSGGEGYTEETGDPNSLGARVAKYAVETYDPWLYSQAKRDEQGYVDCSSMVKRAYEHFGVRIYDQSYSSAEEYRWCENHGGVISGSSLQPGDLIFYATGTHAHSGYYRNIGHVAMFIGNGQIFAAHGEWDNKKKGIRKPPEKQVSVSPYRGDGTYFCRPSNTIH